MYRALKKLTVQAEAKAILTHVEGQNPYEDWRQLCRRFDTRNDATASAIILRLMNAKEWKYRAISELPVSIAKWDAPAREYPVRTGTEALIAVSNLELPKKTLPDEASLNFRQCSGPT